MNNIRQIITERLENAHNDHRRCLEEIDYPMFRIDEIKGSILAYQDCLNLIPAPRTEADILKDFEKLGWKVADGYTNFTLKKKITCNDEKFMWSWICYISIDKENKTYRVFKNGNFSTNSYEINMQEHKLLNELFNLYGWL